MKIEHFEFFQKLKALPFVDRIILYGSRAREDHTERADIDLAMDCPAATKEDWLQIMHIIEEADTLLKIDCVRLDELLETNFLYQSIIKEGVILFEREKK